MPDRALAAARKAIALDPDYWIACVGLGDALASAQMFDEAIVPLEKACQIAPWFAIALGTLAGVLVRSGNRVRAAQIVQQLQNLPGSQTAIGMVLYHCHCLEAEAAAAWFAKAIDHRDPWALTAVQARSYGFCVKAPTGPR
jgi:tetratricopeptide (TPR) repeat protein